MHQWERHGRRSISRVCHVNEYDLRAQYVYVEDGYSISESRWNLHCLWAIVIQAIHDYALSVSGSASNDSDHKISESVRCRCLFLGGVPDANAGSAFAENTLTYQVRS